MQGVGPTARAYRTAALNATLNVFAKVPLDTIDTGDDPAGLTDTAHYFGGTSAQLVTNGGKFLVPGPGTFRCSWVATAISTADAQAVIASLYRGNGGGAAAEESRGSLAQAYAAVVSMPSTGSMDVVCVAGDWLELWIFCNSARALTVTKATTCLCVQQVG